MREKRTRRTARARQGRRAPSERSPSSGVDTVTYVAQMETRWGAPHLWVTLLAAAVLGLRAMGSLLDRRNAGRDRPPE